MDHVKVPAVCIGQSNGTGKESGKPWYVARFLIAGENGIEFLEVFVDKPLESSVVVSYDDLLEGKAKSGLIEFKQQVFRGKLSLRLESYEVK